MEAYELLKRFNCLRDFNETELLSIKSLCENNEKLKRLAKRYSDTGSYHSVATLIKTFDELYPTSPMTPADFAKLIDSAFEVK
jgi:hypothetical protein